ncbi:hypothetical protein CC78DRAFT_540618 [Lojkania enalia]|uniref:Uncharacterized protein n=1 Tax=Lojkania enalia TaxID=147567 RepID=A0A9P4KH88_9PLEO|nr:hypothetical protein CC78DRAFT_540618 [Didymosphaeria enalia]
MRGQPYSIDQLQYLRNSPLVQKPDGLPSIEQWMEVPAEQNSNNNNANRRRSGLRDDTTTGENRERPLLINAGMGHFGRRSSAQPDDTVLGPPKLSFTSASRVTKASDNAEKRSTNPVEGELGDRFPTRDRWTRDRDTDRNREKTSFTNGRRAPREDGEGWTNVKSRKSLGQDDFDRGFGRSSDRDRERHSKDGEGDASDGPTRRTGTGRDKFERWSRRDDINAKEGEGSRFSGAGQGGWRDRERDRDRDKDRDWNRGAGRVEEDPEWMDTRAGSEKKQAKTQEDFQKWKESMKAKDTAVEEKEEPKTEQALTPEQPIPSMFSPIPPSKLSTPLEQPQGLLFGNWGKDKIADGSAPETAPKPKQKHKSKFANMFAKPEDPAILSQPAAPTSASPGLDTNGSNQEDKEGFQRILQMLGGASIAPTQGPQPAMPQSMNGARQGGISLEPQHQALGEDAPEPKTQTRQQAPRTVEQQNILENILAPRPSGPENIPSQARLSAMSPNSSLLEQFGLPRPDSNRPGDEFPIQQPPSRNSSAQDAHLHAILNSRAREEANRDQDTKQRERDFLLTLMQQPTRNTPPQLLGQNLPRPGPDNQNLPPFFEQPAQRTQGQPKGRIGGMPPGFLEDPRLFNENEMIRREAERREVQLREASMREMSMQQQQQEAMRKNPRLPMGNFPDDPMLAGLQRRNTASEIPRQMTNMGIPSQPIPDMPYMRGTPGMPPTPQERNIAPPPGFGGPAAMRQPPGFGGPQGGPQMPPSFSAGNTPLGHPPGIPPPRGSIGGIFQGPGQSNMPPQGPPQGYFPPPPFAPPMGMRGEDPRMMMGRPDFEQFGGPGQPGGPRRPPNMY